jgi:hypothetical protein
MPLINGNKFKKIIRRYSCEDDVVSEFREYILTNCTLSDAIKMGRSLVTLTDNSDRWLLPKRKDRFFDVAFTYWEGVPPGYKARRGVYSFGVSFEVAEELTSKEYESRKDIIPMEDTLRAAKSVINSTHIIMPWMRLG